MNRRGYTLMEVLLAIGLIAMLAGAANAFFWQLLGARSRLVGSAQGEAAIAALLNRLEDDLTSAIAGDAKLGAGIRGDAGSIRVLSRGRWLDAGANVAPTDLVSAEYSFSEEAGELRARRWAVLVATSEPALETVAVDVRMIRFRYFDGREWRDSFDSTRELPAAIEVSVWLGPPLPSDDAAPADFDTKVAESEFEESRGNPSDQRGDRPDPASASRQPHDQVELDERLGAPDRVRVIVVPDGPGSAWRQTR
ncbi:MAG: prepilin-type N-terminal cleavage/methylation domain-containing protein [Phycisphaerales bacterium]